MKMKSEDKSIGRESGAGIRDPKRIKTEKSGQDAGTKKETAASEASGKADLTESRAHVDLPAMSLPPGVAGNAKLRNSLRKYGNPSPYQLANYALLDCFDEIIHKGELIEEYSRMAADPCIPPAEAKRFREKAIRSLSEELCLRNGRLPQLKSDLAVARRMTVAAQQHKPILPGWKRGKLVLKQTPNRKIPAVFYYGKTAKREGITYTVADGMAWKIVCDLIHAEAYDGHGLELKKSPSDHFKRNHRLFFTQRMNHDGKFWYIKTV